MSPAGRPERRPEGVGARVPRLDGAEKVTGEALFGADVRLPGMLAARLLLSPHPHARILRVDAGKARRLPGVKAVLTAKEAPAGRFGRFVKDESLFASDRVRFAGERVAAVAAVDEETAAEALSLIRVDYEPLPALLGAEEAMAEGALLLHPYLASYGAFPGNVRFGNVPCRIRIKSGGAEEALARAPHVFEDEFETQPVHQGYLEPRACAVKPEAGGRFTVWTPTQGVFAVRASLADALGIGLSRLRVIGTHVGGAFGGKQAHMLEAVALLLAGRAGRPVRIVLSREEETRTGNPRHPLRIRLETGVGADGLLLARRARIVADTGAYTTTGPNVLGKASYTVVGPYRVPNVSVEALLVYTNHVPSGSFRGLGVPQAAFASEVQMDRIARALGMDPIELRLRNAFREGDRDATGNRLYGVGLTATIQRAARAADWERRERRPYEGYPTGGGPSGATIRANEDGSFHLAVGSVDLGTGAATLVAQVAAQELGVPMGRLVVTNADTDTTPFDLTAGGSRTTFNIAHAMRNAAGDLKRQVLEEAAGALEASPEDLEFAEGFARVKAEPGRRVSLKEAIARSHKQGQGPLIGRGSHTGRNPAHDPSTVEGHPEPARPAPEFATQIAHVRVNPETGEVEVLRLVNAQDVGFAINPLQLEGQMEGGAVQGLGYALSEDLPREGGRVSAPGLEHMLMPTSLDVGAVESLIVEEPAFDGPYGAKGAGETPIIPTAAAVANAVADAVGEPVRELPLTPERVLRAVRRAGGGRPRPAG